MAQAGRPAETRFRVAVRVGRARHPVTGVPEEWSSNAPRLTPAGRERSLRLTRAHELWEQFLRREVGLEADHVHDAAEWIEHYLNEEKVERLDELLGAKPPPSGAT